MGGGNRKGRACVTSMGGNVDNGVSVLDGCSGRASIYLFLFIYLFIVYLQLVIKTS